MARWKTAKNRWRKMPDLPKLFEDAPTEDGHSNPFFIRDGANSGRVVVVPSQRMERLIRSAIYDPKQKNPYYVRYLTEKGVKEVHVKNFKDFYNLAVFSWQEKEELDDIWKLMEPEVRKFRR